MKMKLLYCENCRKNVEVIKSGFGNIGGLSGNARWTCANCHNDIIEKKNRMANAFGLAFMILSVIALVVFMNTALASAEVQSLGVFKQYECVKLIQICGNCTYNNVTSVLYHSSSLSGVQIMTKTGTEYNSSFCSTSGLGNYIVNGVGDDNGIISIWSYDFDITSTGNNNNLYLTLIIGIFAMLLLVAGIFVRNAFLGLFSGFLFIILGIYSMIYGLGVIQDQYTQMISYVIIGLGVVISFASIYEMYDEGEGD